MTYIDTVSMSVTLLFFPSQGQVCTLKSSITEVSLVPFSVLLWSIAVSSGFFDQKQTKDNRKKAVEIKKYLS